MVDQEALEAVDRQIEGLIVEAIDEIGATVGPILEEAGAEQWIEEKSVAYEQLAEIHREAVGAQVDKDLAYLSESAAVYEELERLNEERFVA